MVILLLTTHPPTSSILSQIHIWLKLSISSCSKLNCKYSSISWRHSIDLTPRTVRALPSQCKSVSWVLRCKSASLRHNSASYTDAASIYSHNVISPSHPRSCIVRTRGQGTLKTCRSYSHTQHCSESINSYGLMLHHHHHLVWPRKKYG